MTMTIISQLIRLAEEGATELEIPDCDVHLLAELMHQTVRVPSQPTYEECEAAIRSGEARLAGVLLKVVPALAKASPTPRKVPDPTGSER